MQQREEVRKLAKLIHDFEHMQTLEGKGFILNPKFRSLDQVVSSSKYMKDSKKTHPDGKLLGKNLLAERDEGLQLMKAIFKEEIEKLWKQKAIAPDEYGKLVAQANVKHEKAVYGKKEPAASEVRKAKTPLSPVIESPKTKVDKDFQKQLNAKKSPLGKCAFILNNFQQKLRNGAVEYLAVQAKEQKHEPVAHIKHSRSLMEFEAQVANLSQQALTGKEINPHQRVEDQQRSFDHLLKRKIVDELQSRLDNLDPENEEDEETYEAKCDDLKDMIYNAKKEPDIMRGLAIRHLTKNDIDEVSEKAGKTASVDLKELKPEVKKGMR